jgi:hypothetical protein
MFLPLSVLDVVVIVPAVSSTGQGAGFCLSKTARGGIENSGDVARLKVNLRRNESGGIRNASGSGRV